ncbi:peptidoglycan-binding protein [Microseira wollei]|uniref:Peptidoglycan-binding domain-containing protein n=1 Tax=Microseira wollei NIES-4236 TaxID=2530354 RepID=A0AAV3XJ02_9CYAN|nr:peptidoglycan-binding protein [Microseira wollei]GET41870.1 putative peptidoglycan-binding domain-containing protein [Microseira wollei NIES-4236]
MSNEDLETNEFELCLDIFEGEARAAEQGDAEPRGPWSGLIKDAPGCSTEIVNGLSQQLIHQVNAISGNLLVPFDDLDNLELGPAAWPFLIPPAKEALGKAIQDRGTKLKVNSAYRTLPQQYLLFKWGNGCGYPIVAKPGTSNHQSGIAIDIDDPGGWRPYLSKYGWVWLGEKDPPHFDYKGAGTQDLRSSATLAFQKLWNKNNPNQKITEDGAYGNQVQGCLNQTLAKGFEMAPWDDHPRTMRLFSPRMQGSDVQKLQEALIKAGFTLDADGVYGPGTDTAVKQFQEKNGMTVDGIVGSQTLVKLIT